MSLHVKTADWSKLSNNARNSIVQMLHENRMLAEDETLIVAADSSAPVHEPPPSLLDTDILDTVRMAALAGLEAVAVTYITHLSDPNTDQDVSFVVAYQADGSSSPGKEGFRVRREECLRRKRSHTTCSV